ncbi:hypothetical protein MC885_014664 [Smutsia gigantea]|nr:hypothetical protein MC885_014664 [Smutsia gigantea]
MCMCDHDDRWETKEAVSPAPEAPQTPPLEETPVQPPETPAPAHRPPEDEGEEEGEKEEEEEEEGEDDDGEDEEWEDVSEDEEEIEEEEEEGEEEEEPAQDHQLQEAAPPGSPISGQAGEEPSRPEEPVPRPQNPAPPPSPFSPSGGHQPVSDWGEEMELNSSRTAHPADALCLGGDQPAPASLESGPSLPGIQKAEEEGSEAAPEAGPEGQETAEITDFQRVRFCKVVAAASPPGTAR